MGRDECDSRVSVQDDMTLLPIEGMNSYDESSNMRANFWIPQAVSDGRNFAFNTEIGDTSVEFPSEFDPGTNS